MSVENDKIETVFSSTIRAFMPNVDLLLLRYKRFTEITEDALDRQTYFDSIIVQLRALTCEVRDCIVSKNYTIQGVLSRLGCEDLRVSFQKFIEQEIDRDQQGIDYTYKKAIKIISDKFICHYDNYTDDGDIANCITPKVASDLVRLLLHNNNLERLIFKIREVIGTALEKSKMQLSKELIINLFGSQEEYEKIKNYAWPHAEQ